MLKGRQLKWFSMDCHLVENLVCSNIPKSDAVYQLLVGSPLALRLKGRFQTKCDLKTSTVKVAEDGNVTRKEVVTVAGP